MKDGNYKYKSVRQFKRCVKAWSLLVVYHNADVDGASDDFCQASFNYVDKELLKMRLPDGWNQHAEYRDFVNWFIKNTCQ